MALHSYNLHIPARLCLPQIPSDKAPATHASLSPTRRTFSLFTITTFLSGFAFSHGSSTSNYSWSKNSISDFVELPNSGGVKALDLRIVNDGEAPSNGDKVVIHYYGRLAAKQGWRFNSTYDHKDDNGEPIPFEFVLGSGKVISGIESSVRSMKVGSIRRVIIPPSEGYQSTSQEPIPPNFFVRQRLFTTIFNPARLANGEGSILGTLIFDIELVSVRRQCTFQLFCNRSHLHCISGCRCLIILSKNFRNRILSSYKFLVDIRSNQHVWLMEKAQL